MKRKKLSLKTFMYYGPIQILQLKENYHALVGKSVISLLRNFDACNQNSRLTKLAANNEDSIQMNQNDLHWKTFQDSVTTISLL